MKKANSYRTNHVPDPLFTARLSPPSSKTWPSRLVRAGDPPAVPYSPELSGDRRRNDMGSPKYLATRHLARTNSETSAPIFPRQRARDGARRVWLPSQGPRVTPCEFTGSSGEHRRRLAFVKGPAQASGLSGRTTSDS